MSQEKATGPGAPPAPESYYTQQPQAQQAQQAPQHSNETALPDYDIPPYNPGASQYADHQGYAYTQSGAAPAFATDTGSASGSASHRRFGFADRLSALGAKAASPINLLANKMGSEGFLPDTMDKECEKAARVLKGFCKHGIYAETEHPIAGSSTPSGAVSGSGPTKKQKSRTIVTIPAKVIQKAVGLAIFTTGRVGFHLSGATGSGVLIARLPDGSWSPPSGIQIHSVGAGFVIGADIYDCVLVLNSYEALEAFRSTRVSLGSDLAVVAGPYGAGGSVDIGASADRRKKDGDKVGEGEAAPGAGADPASGVPTATAASAETKTTPAFDAPPTSAPGKGSATPPKDRKSSALRQTINKASYSYIKSRGIYAGIKVDGTVVTERQSANAAFYGVPVTVEHILRGDVPSAIGNSGRTWQSSVQLLLAAVRAAEAVAVSAPAPAAAAPQQQQAPAKHETWANAAPAAVIHPGTSAYPTAPATVPATDPTVPPGQYRSTEDDAEETYTQHGTFTSTSAAPGYSKAQEAAAESAAARSTAGAGPPPPEYTYSQGTAAPAASSDVPPAYVEDDLVHPGTGDSKTAK